MKSQKGVTLVSLTIYVIAVTIIIAGAATINAYFFKNTVLVSGKVNPLTEYTKFNSSFTEEVNHSKIKVLDCQENYIVFNNKVQYMFVKDNKGIYKDKVKICSNVEACKFEYKIQNGKDIVTVNIKMENLDEKKIDYILKN